jgi:hypothetical protein
MGMYTECYVNVRLVENLPKKIIEVLEYLFDNSWYDNDEGMHVQEKQEPAALPDHKFFSTCRWRLIGSGASFYHIPFPTSKILLELDQYYLTSRSDLKNYEGEIELFFDWLMPYIDAFEGEFIGYSRYEEDDMPQLFFKVGKK